MINLFTKMAYFILLKIDKEKINNLFTFSPGIIDNYIVYPRTLSPIGIFTLRLGFRRIFLNLLVLSPG